MIWGLFGVLGIAICIWYFTKSSIGFERIEADTTFFAIADQELRPGINVFTAETHRRGNIHQVIFVGYKPSKSIQVIAQDGVVHVYYEEDPNQLPSSQHDEAISFDYDTRQKNIHFFINNSKVNPSNKGWAIE